MKNSSMNMAEKAGRRRAWYRELAKNTGAKEKKKKKEERQKPGNICLPGRRPFPRRRVAEDHSWLWHLCLEEGSWHQKI